MSKPSSWSRWPSSPHLRFRCSTNWHAMSDEEAATIAGTSAAEIRARVRDPSTAADWVSLVYRLPEGLRQVLLEELDRGNLLVEIAESSWPTPRSIIGTMHDRFHGEGRTWPPGVVWQQVNDPRQWREDVSEILDDQEFLLMT
ncbi:hypothetical protein [Roseateles sp.]|uniref:hypothetical protein n=1 Tax=Roseateles sp. TaxID=1971397 RepID=UPI002F3F9D6C